MAAVKTYGCTMSLDGPTPPDYMLANNTQARGVLDHWLRQNNEHLYHHEQVRLAEGAVKRARSRYAPGYLAVEAKKRLADAKADYDAYHEGNR